MNAIFPSGDRPVEVSKTMEESPGHGKGDVA